MSASNFTGDLRVPHIEDTTNGRPIDCKTVVDGVTYYRQRVAAFTDDISATGTLTNLNDALRSIFSWWMTDDWIFMNRRNYGT